MYCQKCGTQNPEGTNNCSNCGAPLNATPVKPKKKKTGLIIAVVAIIAVIAIIAALGGGGDKTPDTSSDANASTSAASAAKTKTAKDFEVKLKDSFATDDYDGKPVLVVTYEFKNTSEQKASWMIVVDDTAMQNGIGLNKTYTSYGISDYSSDNQQKEIMPGKTLEVQEAYYLNDETTQVEIQIAPAFSLTDAIYETFKIDLV